MKPFRYRKAPDEAAAVQAAAAEGAAYLAGGTTLVDLMRLEVMGPDTVVDINALPHAQIESTAEGVRIGALARNTEVAYHPAIQSRFPVLSEALLAGASPQLRNMATVGGNLMQRTRCSYFRDPVWACNKRRPGSGCSAMDGYTRMHAVLGTSDHCIAAHPSDMCVALVALDAVVHTRGPKGERAIAITDFHLAPSDHPEVETVLDRGELITHVVLPASSFAARSHYLKVRDRASYAFALASAAVALDLRGGRIEKARVALGGVATKPWRSLEAEGVLEGRAASEATYREAALAAFDKARTRPDNAFKVELGQRVLVRALEEVGGAK